MVTVNGLTAERMLEIEAASVVDGEVVGDSLILKRFDDSTINAGSVRGPQGIVGPVGPTSIEIVTSTTRPGSPTEGLYIHEIDTDRLYMWNGVAWVYRGGMLICTSTTRPSTPHEGLEIFETDTDRFYFWTGLAWRYKGGGTNPTAARAYATAGTAMALLAFTNIALAGESYDYGNNFSASAYTCPETGLYDVRGALAMSAQDTVTRMTCGISVNGSVVAQGGDLHIRGMNVNDAMGVTIADQIACAAGDIVRFVGFQNNNGGASRFSNTGVQTHMAIRRL